MKRAMSMMIFFALAACKERSPTREYGGLALGAPQRFCRDRPIRTQGIMLPIPVRSQECSERCWAAVLGMLSRYYGKNLQECDFAGRRSERNCCIPDSCNNEPCNLPASEAQIGDMMEYELGLHYQYIRGQLTEANLQSELSNGRPVVVGFGREESNHVSLVIGFITVEKDGGRSAVYHLADPWPDIGLLQIGYPELLAGPNPPLPWSASWMRISPREDGCNENFDQTCGCPSK